MNTAPPGAPHLRVSHFYKYNHWKVGPWRRYRPGSSTKGLRGPLALRHTGATSPCQFPAAPWPGYETGSGEKGQRHVTCSYITVPQYQSKPEASPATQVLAHVPGSEWGAVRVMRARAWAGVLARGQQYAISGASSTACLMQQSTTPVKHSTTQSPRLPTHRHTMKTFLLRPHDAAAR